MIYTNSQDEKIMNYHGNSYEEFVALFTEEEVEEMRQYLERNLDYDYSYTTEKELAELVSIAYLQEWLIQQIREFTYNGTEHLFNLLYSIS